MPKYTQAVAEAKAKNLIKPYIRNGLNQTRLAKEEGVSQSAINQRLKHPIVKKTFADLMSKAGLTDTYLRKKMKEGLEANRVVGYLNNKVDGVQKVSDDFVEVPDLHCRHKYLVTALEVKGIIKHNGNGKGISIVNINYGYRGNTPDPALRAEARAN